MPFWSSKIKGKKITTEGHASGSAPKSPVLEQSSLRFQVPTPASSATKIRLSLLATAMVDALGAPAEFQTRFSFPFITSMEPNNNFGQPPGVWTDDTSMTLCLTKSISTFKETPNSPYTGGFDEVHQLELYRRWHKDGYLSAIGKCFDIGTNTQRALDIFSRYSAEEALLRIRSDLAEEKCSGNGSLMRIIPIGLAYWRDESQAKTYARRSSQATHPNTICIEACEMWTGAIGLIMEETTEPPQRSPEDNEERQLTKLTLLEYISNFPFTHNKLREALTLPFGVGARPEGKAEREAWYYRYHPLMRLIKETQGPGQAQKDPKFPYNIPTEEQLPSSGYVLHTIVAALYCFFTTRTFEEGALMAVNLGNDADTVGSIYAGLAACWYADKEGKAEGVFWTKKVREWRKELVKRSLVEEVAENLVAWERSLADEYM